jgi:hypothetical protein
MESFVTPTGNNPFIPTDINPFAVDPRNPVTDLPLAEAAQKSSSRSQASSLPLSDQLDLVKLSYDQVQDSSSEFLPPEMFFLADLMLGPEAITGLSAKSAHPPELRQVDKTNPAQDQITGLNETQFAALATLSQSLATSLEAFADSSELIDYLDLISHRSWALNETTALLEDLARFEAWPELEILPFRDLKARGAFGNNTIYLSQEFLEQNLAHPQRIAAVVLEEIGHYLDSRLSQKDAPGDEGAIFASLVQKQPLSAAALFYAKTENDQALIEVEGQTISVELASWDPSSTPFPKTRDPWEWPFAAESIWNLPLGSHAVYEPANLETGVRTSADLELLYQVSENDPLTRLYAPYRFNQRCQGTKNQGGQETYIRFPEDQVVPDADPPHTPNNATSILQPDGETIVEMSTFARCQPGGPAYGWYAGERNIYDNVITGGTGGSNLSALGGTIRLGELTNNEPIRHALKVNIWSDEYLSYNSQDQTPGYRWPAQRADRYAANRYGGTNPELEMGALLAIPPDVTPESLGIESRPALKLFYALQDYGAYVVDDSGWNVTAFNLEEGVEEEFEQTYGYSFSTNKKENRQWFNEYYALITSLHIVTNNGPDKIGGGGSRRAPLAPPFGSEANNSS